jgi:ParB-like chromosome segregation protein Spo0J
MRGPIRSARSKQVAESIKAFGHLVPILIDEAGFVPAGHARLAAAKLIGLQAVPTIVALGSPMPRSAPS